MEQFYLKNIELFHFRKFDNAVYEFNPRMNVVIGQNASGKMSVLEAALKFYKSETYKTLQETENGLWAESAEYIADRYYEEAAANVVS